MNKPFFTPLLALFLVLVTGLCIIVTLGIAD